MRISKELKICVIAIVLISVSACNHQSVQVNDDKLLSDEFATPPMEFRPKVRWWWPGGDVEEMELTRELHLLADNMFGGAEIQPFTGGMDRATLQDSLSAIYQYGTPAYYTKLEGVLAVAKDLGLTIDLTMGSGWNAGSAEVPLSDNVKMVIFGEATISGSVDIPVPAAEEPYAYSVFSSNSQNFSRFNNIDYYPGTSTLKAVVAAKIVDNGRSPDPTVIDDTIELDPATAVDVTAYVEEGRIRWTPPSDGDWQVVAIYSMPSGSHVLLTADPKTSFMVNPYDRDAIIRYYDSWLGDHPEILSYAGGTLRALFNDSYEYFSQRLFSEDFIEVFKENRGYDITPYLPVSFQPGRDQSFFRSRSQPDFSFGEVSERLTYDYDLTLSDMQLSRWHETSLSWTEENNLKYRQQGYGPPLDVIKAAGMAHIPETEGLNEKTLKEVSSGAHLADKTVIAAESFVFYPGGSFGITPQKYKQGIDVLMTSGVNEIIYHGMPYRWNQEGYGEIGWTPFSTPSGGSDIATTISEVDTFWPYMKDINTYAARLQYLLRKGMPSSDVLVYLPRFGNPNNARFAPVLEFLSNQGIAWEWVNEDIIESATWTGSALTVGELSFKAVVIPSVEAMPVSTAAHLVNLAESGLPVIIYGEAPSRQPGFAYYELEDEKVRNSFQAVLSNPSSGLASSEEQLGEQLNGVIQTSARHTPNSSVRFIRRQLGQDAQVTLFRNTSATSNQVIINIGEYFQEAFWLDPRTGKIYVAEIGEDRTVSAPLAGEESMVLLEVTSPYFDDNEISEGTPFYTESQAAEASFSNWRLEVSGPDVPDGSVTFDQNVLFNWNEHDVLKYVSSSAIYSVSLAVGQIDPTRQYYIHLGELHGAAEVEVNGVDVGKAIYQPYQVEITDALQSGDNAVTITVVPPLRNRLLGKAKNRDEEYAQFTRAADSPIPSGLVGPITITFK